MPTTILEHIQDFCELQNLPVPTAIMGSAEKSSKQFRAIIRSLIRDLSEFRWQRQRIETTWVGTIGSDQGALPTIFGTGYDGLVPDTLWNETRKMRIYGPLSEPIWTAMQVLPNAGPEYQCWIGANRLFLSPALDAQDTLRAVYITKNNVLAVNGITYKAEVDADDDSVIFPDNVFAHGIEYKWKKQKGESGWEDDYNTFIGLVAKNLVKDSATKLSLGTTYRGPQPGIVIPSGSWNV